MFSNDSQLLEHTSEISFVAPMDQDQIASLSGDVKNQTLIVSGWDGMVQNKHRDLEGIVGLKHSDKHGLMFLRQDGSVKDLTGKEIQLGLPAGKTIAFAADTDFAVGFDFDR